ncbi:MAG: hypothetical protein U1D55_15880 [Phycisphaerae bacterium]
MPHSIRALIWTISFCALSTHTFAQTIDWQRTFANGASAGTSLATDLTGNLFVAGYTAADSAVTVLKLGNTNGLTLWTRALPFSGFNGGQDPPQIGVDEAGDAYVLCTSPSGSSTAMTTVKLSGVDGFELWRDTHAPAPSGARGRAIAVRSDRIVVLGDNGARFDVIQYAPNGARRWLSQTPVSSTSAVGGNLIVDSVGQVYFCGSLGAGPQPFFVAALSASGATRWSDALPAAGVLSTSQPQIALDETMGLALGGEYRTSANALNAVTISYDPNGLPRRWVRSSTSDGASQVAIDPVSGDIYVGGNRATGGPVARRLAAVGGTQVWRRTFGTTTSRMVSMIRDARNTLWFVSATASTNSNYSITSVNGGNGVAGSSFTASIANDQPAAMTLDHLRNVLVTGGTGSQYLTVKLAQDSTAYDLSGPAIFARPPADAPADLVDGTQRVRMTGRWRSSIVTQDGLLDDSNFTGYLSLVLYPIGFRYYDQILVHLGQGYAGGLLDNLADENLPRIAISAATRWDEPAWGQSLAGAGGVAPDWPRSFFSYAWNQSISASSTVGMLAGYNSSLTQSSFPVVVRDQQAPEYFCRTRAIDTARLHGSPDRNYALLIVGSDLDSYANGATFRSSRFYFDAWRAYLALRNTYGYPASDIYVLYADGTPPPGAGTLPDSPAAAPMPIDGPATTATINAYFGTGPAANILGQDDQLFIWVGGNGARSYVAMGVVDLQTTTTNTAEAEVELDLGVSITGTLAQHHLTAPLRVTISDVYVPAGASPPAVYLNGTQIAASVSGLSTSFVVPASLFVSGANSFRFVSNGANASATEIGGIRIDLQAEGGPAVPIACLGDLNGDGVVDSADLGVLLGAWQTSAAGDLDGDGDTDQADLGVLLANWQSACQ